MTKEKQLVDLECLVCGKEFRGEEPQYCCNGYECGCMGMVEPPICSGECWDRFVGGRADGADIEFEEIR